MVALRLAGVLVRLLSPTAPETTRVMRVLWITINRFLYTSGKTPEKRASQREVRACVFLVLSCLALSCLVLPCLVSSIVGWDVLNASPVSWLTMCPPPPKFTD
jgi:hypothetical protein